MWVESRLYHKPEFVIVISNNKSQIIFIHYSKYSMDDFVYLKILEMLRPVLKKHSDKEY